MVTMALCDDKENISKKTQQEHGPPLIDMAPLLISLHVNEAEKTGLVGNSMALYERFTVLPHIFAQVSGPCRPSSAPMSCSEQSVFTECHHSSLSSCLPFLPPSSRAQSFTCPFFGTIGGTMASESRPMDALGQPPAAGDALLDTVAMTTTGDNLKRRVLKTADQCTSPQPSNNTSHNKRGFASLHFGQGICDTPAADVIKLVEGAQFLSIGDGLRSVSRSSQEEGCTCAGKESGKAIMTEGMQFEGPVTDDVKVIGQCCSAGGRMDTRESDLNRLKESSHDGRSACGSICKTELGSALPSRDVEAPKEPLESISPIFDMIVGANTCKVGIQLPCFPVGNKCGACGESANRTNCKFGIVEPSQHDIKMGDSFNHAESGCAIPLSPSAVVQAVGQHRFWKARLALIRQQRIFSDQVFELHKLIEVQRLLAGSSNIFIDESYSGVGNMNIEYNAVALASHSHLVDKEEKIGETLGKQVSTSKDAYKAPRIVGEANTKLTNCPAHSKKCPEDVENGASAWGYPSRGLGPDGAAMTRSPLSPYGFPGCLQKPHLTPSVESSYGSAVASVHQQHSAPYLNSSFGYEVSDHSRPRTLNKNHSTAEAPTVSVASISSLQYQIKAAYPSSFNSQLHMHKREVQSGRKGLRAFGSQAEDLQNTAMGSKFNMSTMRPPNDICEHSEQGSTQAPNTQHHDFDVQKLDSLSKEVRGWKRQKEKQYKAHFEKYQQAKR